MRRADLVSGASYDQRADVRYRVGRRLPYKIPEMMS